MITCTKDLKKSGLTEVTFARISVQRFFYDLNPNGDYWKQETSSEILRGDCLQASLTDESFIYPIPDSCRETLTKNGLVSIPSPDTCLYDKLISFLEDNHSNKKNHVALLQEIAEETARDFLQKK